MEINKGLDFGWIFNHIFFVLTDIEMFVMIIVILRKVTMHKIGRMGELL